MRVIILGGFIFSSLLHAEDIFTNEFEGLVAARVNNLQLKDPHLFSEGFGCNDITSFLNDAINQQITADGDGDGLLDISLVSQFTTDQPNYISTKPLEISLVDALCVDAVSCSYKLNLVSGLATSVDQTTACLAPISGSTSAYIPGVLATSAPCYTTEPQDTTLYLNGIEIPLQAYQQASRYQSGLSLDEGLLMGFISESAAIAVVIPDNVPLVGGETLFNLLAGGGSCSSSDDRDLGPDGITSGWWFYFNSTSDLVELTGV